MFYEVLRWHVLKDGPADDANFVSDLAPGEIAREVSSSSDGSWVEVAVFSSFTAACQGWTRLEENGDPVCRQVEEPPRPDFSEWGFLKACVSAERRFNGADEMRPFFIAADYLIALANIETGIKNEPNLKPGGDGVGPFQITTGEWAEFLTGPMAEGFVALDREDPLDQISGAAHRAMLAMRRISEAVAADDQQRGDTETAGPTGPYVPSYVDVLIADLLGPDVASALRIAERQGRGGDPIEPAVTQARGQDAAPLLQRYARFFVNDATGQPETVAGAYERAGDELTKEFANALELIKTHIPEDLPVTTGSAPWFAEAEAEKQDWEGGLFDESTAGGRARVLQYFQEIAYATDHVQPWCGAFAGHCMIAAGGVYGQSLAAVGGPARAANWARWGNVEVPKAAPDVPQGAVVLLARDPGVGGSGHIGFFAGFDGDKVALLGGNQSDTVKVSRFPRAKIASIRWLDTDADRNREEEEQAAGAVVSGHAFGRLLDFIARAESNGNYNAYYGHARNTSNPRLTGMTLSEVLAWQVGRKFSASGRYQFIRKTLRGLVDDGEAGRGDRFDEATQDKLAVALLKRRKLGAFLAGKISRDAFALNLAREWASMPVPFDTQGQHRRVKRGQSYYSGDAVNKALVPVDTFLAAIDTIRQ